MRNRLYAVAGLLALALVASPLVFSRAELYPANVGQKVGDFTLKDTAGQSVAFAGFKDARAFVVFFVGTECPINNNYVPRLKELHQEYAGKGVQFLAVNANRQDTAARVAEHAKKHALPFPVLKDEGNAVADQLAAERTPEAFVLDASHTIRYRGRIDDQFEIGVKRPKATRHDLKEALDEVLAGKTVKVPQTTVAGCLIARVVKPKAAASVT